MYRVAHVLHAEPLEVGDTASLVSVARGACRYVSAPELRDVVRARGVAVDEAVPWLQSELRTVFADIAGDLGRQQLSAHHLPQVDRLRERVVAHADEGVRVAAVAPVVAVPLLQVRRVLLRRDALPARVYEALLPDKRAPHEHVVVLLGVAFLQRLGLVYESLVQVLQIVEVGRVNVLHVAHDAVEADLDAHLGEEAPDDPVVHLVRIEHQPHLAGRVGVSDTVVYRVEGVLVHKLLRLIQDPDLDAEEGFHLRHLVLGSLLQTSEEHLAAGGLILDRRLPLLEVGGHLHAVHLLLELRNHGVLGGIHGPAGEQDVEAVLVGTQQESGGHRERLRGSSPSCDHLVARAGLPEQGRILGSEADALVSHRPPLLQ